MHTEFNNNIDKNTFLHVLLLIYLNFRQVDQQMVRKYNVKGLIHSFKKKAFLCSLAYMNAL